MSFADVRAPRDCHQLPIGQANCCAACLQCLAQTVRRFSLQAGFVTPIAEPIRKSHYAEWFAEFHHQMVVAQHVMKDNAGVLSKLAKQAMPDDVWLLRRAVLVIHDKQIVDGSYWVL